MTKKLYYESADTRSWTTEIEHTYEENERYYAILAETAFYPHGGGQPCDLGTMDGIPVIDVFTDGEKVIHEVERLPEKETVTCEIDWQRRFDHMQQHTGQHLLSATFLELADARTVSFHLGTDVVTIDIEHEDVTTALLKEVEMAANKQIYANRPIHTYFVTEEELQDIPLVKQPKVTENIRIVEIEGIEYNACGGTHLSHTGQLGIIKLYKAEKLKTATRIHFKCGYRALDDYNATVQITDRLSETFNTGRKDILDRFGKWQKAYEDLKKEAAYLKEANDKYIMEELLANSDGKLLAGQFTDKPLKDLQKLAAQVAAEHGKIVLFVTTGENKVLITHDGTEELQCGSFYKQHLQAFNGKGGGSVKTAQAAFPDTADALKFYQFAEQELSE